MFGVRHGNKFTAFAPTPGVLGLLGGLPEPVTVSLDPEGDYYGWLQEGDLSYPARLSLGMSAYDEARNRYAVRSGRTRGRTLRFSVKPTDRPKNRLTMLLDSIPLSTAKVRFWQCPVPEHKSRKNTVTVEWVGSVAHCTASGCPLTSENFNYATVEGMS
jgi:uncharacterized protein (DUF1919 family)